MAKSEHGLGTVRAVRSKTGEVIGYQALMPRSKSQQKRGAKPNSRYQEPIGPRCATKDEARRLLDAVIVELTDRKSVDHGLPLSCYVASEINARHTEARRRYKSDARASKSVSTWRSVDRRWLSDAAFYEWPPAAIDLADAQRWIDWLCDEAEGQGGEPLSTSFVRTCGSLLKAAFERTGTGNIMRALRLPKKSQPEIRHLEIAAQRRLYGCRQDEIALRDRVMAGCGMGPGLRVGELLSFEVDDVHLSDRDPHLMVRYGGPDHAPTKGRKVRRVELMEPALGFWRIWMSQFYREGDQRVFAGPSGGYLKAWPELFPSWARVAGVERLSSHVMRHTYAVALLSGSWGYEPMSLEFVSDQLGHADRQTTERYYGAYEFGVWQREVRRVTGREPVRPREPITARMLLGLDAWNDASAETAPQKLCLVGSAGGKNPSSTQTGIVAREPGPNDALTHQAVLVALGLDAEAALASARAAEPTAVAKMIDVLGRVARAGIEAATGHRADGRGTA